MLSLFFFKTIDMLVFQEIKTIEKENNCRRLVAKQLAFILLDKYYVIIFQEHLLSLKCLDSNQKDRDACDVYFENYKVCKKFWVIQIIF